MASQVNAPSISPPAGPPTRERADLTVCVTPTQNNSQDGMGDTMTRSTSELNVQGIRRNYGFTVVLCVAVFVCFVRVVWRS
ncbi:MAG: hypothetical protein ABI586_07255, partial [Candidatus Nanopelagicales bacterium]